MEVYSGLKSPICSFDAKSGVLCSKCEARLGSAAISQDDVDASIKLTKIADHSQEVNKFSLIRGVRVDRDFVLVLRSPDVSVVRGSSQITDRIESEFGQKVWFVESEASDRRFIESLFHPVKVLSINLVWLPDGSKLTKVVIASDPKSRLDIEKVQKIANTVRNIELLVDFESRK